MRYIAKYFYSCIWSARSAAGSVSRRVGWPSHVPMYLLKHKDPSGDQVLLAIPVKVSWAQLRVGLNWLESCCCCCRFWKDSAVKEGGDDDGGGGRKLDRSEWRTEGGGGGGEGVTLISSSTIESLALSLRRPKNNQRQDIIFRCQLAANYLLSGASCHSSVCVVLIVIHSYICISHTDLELQGEEEPAS